MNTNHTQCIGKHNVFSHYKYILNANNGRRNKRSHSTWHKVIYIQPPIETYYTTTVCTYCDACATVWPENSNFDHKCHDYFEISIIILARNKNALTDCKISTIRSPIYACTLNNYTGNFQHTIELKYHIHYPSKEFCIH